MGQRMGKDRHRGQLVVAGKSEGELGGGDGEERVVVVSCVYFLRGSGAPGSDALLSVCFSAYRASS